jgi:deoxyribose-phosphate aldolase
VELEHLVEKITREVMDSVKCPHPSTDAKTAAPMGTVSAPRTEQSAEKLTDVVLIAGSPDVDSDLLKKTLSCLKMGNIHVKYAVVPENVSFYHDGIQTKRCSSASEAVDVIKKSGAVVILLSDIATVSRLANLDADRFDIEAVLSALESEKKLWALRIFKPLPKALQAKVEGFIKEIESFGIKVLNMETGTLSPASRPASSGSVSCTTCSANTGPECAGCGFCADLNKSQVKNIVNSGAERVSASPGIAVVPSEIAGMIDHTLLKPETTREQVLKLCQEARQYSFASCCVNPTWVRTVAECLKGSPVKTCVVVGFPLGANSTVIKEMETRDSIAAGCDEIDMVINVGALKAGDYDLVKRDIEAVVNASQGKIVKVILETALLNDEEKVRGCELAKEAGADFVKTSTGFGPGGATAKDIALMRKTVGKYMGVKASGGIRDFETAREMIEAGATRIGASASVGIVKGASDSGGSGY